MVDQQCRESEGKVKIEGYMSVSNEEAHQWSDQSRVLTLHGQALSITSPYAHILVYHLYLTCLYLPFTERTSLLKPQPIAYMSLPQN